MLKKNLTEKINQIESDINFCRLRTNEDRIDYILENHISRNRFKEIFHMRPEIVRKNRKSYQIAKQYFDRAYDQFVRICRAMKAQNLGQGVSEGDFTRLLNIIEKAILYSPHDRKPDEMNILFKAYILRLRIHIICNSTENIINDYINAVSIHDDMDPSEQFEYDLDYIENSIPINTRQTIDEIYLNKNVKRSEQMPRLKIDKRCVFVTDPERGRYMIAEQDIDSDIYLIEERPQIIALLKSQLDKYCSYCFEKLQNSFYPCLGCIECRFCDKQCAQKATEGFHRFECTLIGYFNDNFRHNWLKGYRVLTSLCTADINQLYNTFLIDGQGFDLEQWVRKYNNNFISKNHNEILCQYKGLSTFVEHSYRNTTRETIEEIIDGIELALLIEEINVFYNLTNDLNFIRLVTMLISHYHKCNANAFAWKEDSVNSGQYLALVSTMINHSCVPNTLWSFSEGMHTIITFNDIKAGDEICLSYGMFAFRNRMYDPFVDRQLHLRLCYNFDCECEGCKREKATVLSYLKCQTCGGIVYYGDVNPDRKCVSCGRIDQNSFYDIRYNYVIKKIIHQFNECVQRSFHSEQSISTADELFQQMSALCHRSSPDLLEMRQRFESIPRFILLPFGPSSNREMSQFYEPTRLDRKRELYCTIL